MLWHYKNSRIFQNCDDLPTKVKKFVVAIKQYIYALENLGKEIKKNDMPTYADLFEILDKRAICAKEGTYAVRPRNKGPRMTNLLS